MGGELADLVLELLECALRRVIVTRSFEESGVGESSRTHVR
jgi:hypothetical protein